MVLSASWTIYILAVSYSVVSAKENSAVVSAISPSFIKRDLNESAARLSWIIYSVLSFGSVNVTVQFKAVSSLG